MEIKEKYISRVDSEKSGMYGYLLRLYRGKGVLFQFWFSDKKYGGKEKTLKTALKLRDEKINELSYNPNVNRKWQPVQLTKKIKSNTGHLGVYESSYAKKNKDGRRLEYQYFAVSYTKNKGENKIKRFYITKKRSRKEALELAIQFREGKEISARIAAVEYNRQIDEKMINQENRNSKKRKKEEKI